MAKAIKVALGLINILLLLLGILMLAVGIWVMLEDTNVIHLGNLDSTGRYGNFRNPGFLEMMIWFSIVSGVAMIALAVLAFIGVAKNSNCMLALYAGMLGLLLSLQAVSIVFAVIIRKRVDEHLEDALFDGVINQYEGNINSRYTFSRSFDQAQVQFKCCGVNSHMDFQNNSTRWIDVTSRDIPKACCKLDEYQYVYEKLYVFTGTPPCKERNITTPEANIDKHCYSEIKDSLDTKILLLLGMSATLALSQLFCLVVSCCFIRSTKDNITVDKY